MRMKKENLNNFIVFTYEYNLPELTRNEAYKFLKKYYYLNTLSIHDEWIMYKGEYIAKMYELPF